MGEFYVEGKSEGTPARVNNGSEAATTSEGTSEGYSEGTDDGCLKAHVKGKGTAQL